MEKYLFYHSPKTVVKRNNRQLLSHYLDSFDFTEHIHGGDKEEIFWNNVDITLEKLKTSNYDYVSDIVASVITTFVNTKQGKDKYFIEGLNCCNDILTQIGYAPATYDELPKIVRDPKNDEIENIILVLGCQTRELIQSRADAAARLYKELFDITREPNRVTVYFSGSSPNKGRQKNLYEYKILRKFFMKEIDNLFQSPGQKFGADKFISIKVDSKSHNTSTNISKFIDDHLIKTFRNRKVNLFIVSSTFHLIRISQALNEQLKNTENQNKINEKGVEIKNITLLGSESDNLNMKVVHHERYVKNMFYDIIHYFLKNKVFKRKTIH